MKALRTYAIWWRSLPLWLKWLTAGVAYPAWFFIGYCILTGQFRSTAAMLAFAAFTIITLLHVMFDRRGHRAGRSHDSELHLSHDDE